MKIDAWLDLRFLTTEEGGRRTPIHSEKFGCPVMISDREGFDCRFVLDGLTNYKLGESYRVPVKFLNPEIALEKLKDGYKIFLWEGKVIAEGVVRLD